MKTDSTPAVSFRHYGGKRSRELRTVFRPDHWRCLGYCPSRGGRAEQR